MAWYEEVIKYIPIIITLLWIISEAYRDAEDINEGDYIKDHTSRTINRGMVGLLSACISPWYGLLVAFLFWVLFDLLLNIFRGLPWNYIGSTSNSDNWAAKNKVKYYTTKIISFIIIALIIHYKIK